MCIAIALPTWELPAEKLPALKPRVHLREGREEVQFHWWHEPAILPVRWEGSLRLCRWGNKDRRSRLPWGGWISREQLEAGVIAQPEEAVIPANLGLDKGTWYVISQGIRAVLLLRAPGGPVVYMLTEPSSNYYRNMTEQSAMMPVFVDQVI